MSYLRINVEKGNKEFVEQLLCKLGYEVTEERVAGKKKTGAKPVSPTLLFNKWSDWEVDPATFRKNLWARKNSIG